MKIRSLFFFFFILGCIRLSAQDTASVIDRVYTTDHKTYEGQITEDHKGDSLTIDVYQNGTHTIDYKAITRIQYRVDNPRYKEAQTGTQPRSVRRETKDTAALDLVAFNGYRASPHVTDKLIKKRNTGIVLTIGGACMAGIGAALYATLPRQSTSSSSGYLVSSPSPSAVAGVLMMAVGIGLTIPGVALWGSYSHRIHKAEMEN